MANLNSIHEVIALSKNKFEWIVEKRIDLLEPALHPNSLVKIGDTNCFNKWDFLGKIVEDNNLLMGVIINKSSPKVMKGSAVIWGEGIFDLNNNGKVEKNQSDYTEVYFKVDGFWKIVFLSID
jgi:hypothetical protein